MHSARRVPSLALLAVLALAGCEKPTHDNIDRWRGTTKGPGKLLDAMKDGDLDADLRAHAAQNLIAIDRFADVREFFGRTTQADRERLMEKLAPRLQRDAAVADKKTVPSPRQLAAKDALFDLRGSAREQDRAAIDDYLTDWLAEYYEGRSKMGRWNGDAIVRVAGAKAAPKLLSAARAIVAAPPDAQGRVLMMGDEMLKGLAYTGSPEAVGFLLDLAGARHVDETLPRRAIGALHLAYIEDTEKPAPDPRALAPHVPRLAGLLGPDKAEDISDNDLFDLIGAAGPPECLAPLVQVVKDPSLDPAYRWVAAQKALRCAKADAVIPVVEALPPEEPFEGGILEKYLWDKILAPDYEIGNAKAAAAARQLLASSSWVARVTGVELLGRAGSKADADAVRALEGDKTVLRGWWGDQREVPKAEQKVEPTLGQRAHEVADQLSKR